MARRAITPVLEARPDTLAGSVERLLALWQWSSVRIGAPEPDDTNRWLGYEQLCDPDAVKRLVVSRATEGEYAEAKVPEAVVGNYLFRDLLSAPLGFVGYLWARERRIPRVAGAVTALDAEWIQHWRWLDPAVAALPGDPIATDGPVETVPDIASLNDAMFGEVRRFSSPILAAFQAHRYVATANAWGSILDAVMYGVQLAGQCDAELGLDTAWSRWDAALEGRRFPVRRRPRRLEYEWLPGQCEELLVRAGCCLWFMTDAAKTDGKQDYCTSCYLKTDEQRIAHMVEWKRKEAAREAATE